MLNHADVRVGLTPADIERVARVPIACHIPTNRDVPVSTNDGTPLMAKRPSHPVSRAIRGFAEAKLLASAVPAGAAVSSPEAISGAPSGRRRSSLLHRGK